MVDYALIQERIDRGKGKAALRLGPPFHAYRCDSAAAGDFPGGWTALLAGATFPLFRRRIPDAKLELGLKNVALLYDIIANMDPFVLGDVFVSADPPYNPGFSYGAGATSLPGTQEFNAMALAWHPPVNKAIGARLDRLVTIWRPAPSPATMGDSSLYWKSTHDNDQPLVLAAGQYTFGTAGTTNASLLPAGLSSQHRQSEKMFPPDVPGMIKPVKWFFYLPPTPGYLAREGDAIVDQNGARYVVLSPYEQETGVVGQQLVCDRTAAQTSNGVG